MIPHYLALASPAFVMNPIKAEILSFCYGFMALSCPWMNDFFGQTFSDPSDNSPSLMKIFYFNLNIASTYLTPLGVIILLLLIGTLVIKLCGSSVEKKRQLSSAIFFNFIYNIFSYGAIFSSIISVQGGFINTFKYILSF